MRIVGQSGLVLFLSAVLWAAAFEARAGMYLYLENMPGDSVHPTHTNWMEGVAFTTESSAVSNYLAIRFEKPLDRASPLLFNALASALPVQKGIIELTRTIGRRQRFFQLKLYDITLNSLSTVAAQGGASRPTEWLSLSCTKVEWTYVEYDPGGINLALGDAYGWWDWPNKQGGTINPDRDSDGDGVPDLADDDADDDGMPDKYEAEGKLLPTVDDALDDLDGDGMGNRDEYWSGTLPTDPSSYFRIRRLEVDKGFVRVTWTSEPGRVYDLYTGDKLGGDFSFVGSFPSQGAETTAEFKSYQVGWLFRVSTPVIIP